MYCGTCLKKFSLMRARRQCSECKRYYCKYCVTRKANKNLNCENCAVLTSRPLNRSLLLKLKARDLQIYLNNKKVSTKGCIEKEDLVNLLLAYANGTDFQSTHNVEETSHSSGRQLFKNIRHFFSSSPDISEQSRPEVNNTVETSPIQENTRNSVNSSPDSNTVHPVWYNEVPSYFQAQQQQHNQNTNNDIGNASCVTAASNASDRIQSATEATPSSTHLSDLISEQSSENISQPSLSGVTSQNTIDNINSESDANISISNTEFTPSENEFLHEGGPSIVYEPFKNKNLSDIKEQSELDDLSVQQLKYLLVRNRVDFKGCVEKTDLLERVKRLWTEYSRSREGLENLPLDDLCKICMDAPIECVMLECGHMATCTTCGKQLSECPICRQYVVRVVRTFRV